MASEEDNALLFLIYQHLKVSGFSRAARLLEKHVSQVETPEEISNLHDIYTGWMKLCSLAQHAKQETEDSNDLKKESIKPEPATSEEEGAADTEPSNTTKEESKADVIDSSNGDTDKDSEQLLDVADKTQTSNASSEEEKVEEQETETKQESAPTEVSAEATNKAESSNCASSDSEEMAEPTEGDPEQPASDQTEGHLQAEDPAEKMEEDELKQ
uniref:Uncharacterized protein n=1 Tax=Amphiprion percula TaxID=161767 RepID=A0A3P8TA14_AMPPE